MHFDCNCDYCRIRTYIWSVDDDSVWVEIPKNASTLIKDNIYRKKLSMITDSDVTNFKKARAILRNPFDRFKSLIAHYFIDGGRLNMGIDWLNSIGVSDVNNETVVDVVLENVNKLHLIGDPHHWNEQRSFMPDSVFLIDHEFIDIKDVSSVFSIDAQINTSSSNNVSLSSAAVDALKSMYVNDFDLYDTYILKSNSEQNK